jgi:hypothetical protein
MAEGPLVHPVFNDSANLHRIRLERIRDLSDEVIDTHPSGVKDRKVDGAVDFVASRHGHLL